MVTYGKKYPHVDENLILSKQRPSLDNKDLGNKICSETDYIMYITTYIYHYDYWHIAALDRNLKRISRFRFYSY